MKQKTQIQNTRLDMDNIEFKKLNSNPYDNKLRKDSYQRIKKYRYGDYMSKFSLQKWVEKYKRHFKKRKMFFIIMQLRNGKYDMFTVTSSTNCFGYSRGTYYLDPDMVREDVHTGLNALYYHQDCAIPFKIDFNIDELRTTLQDHKGIEKAINPNNLKGFVNSQVIEKVLKGQELSDDIKQLRMFIIINLLITVILGIMLAKTMGYI